MELAASVSRNSLIHHKPPLGRPPAVRELLILSGMEYIIHLCKDEISSIGADLKTVV